MTQHEKGPGTNWLAPLMGGLALLFFGVVIPIATGGEISGLPMVLALAGLAFVIYGLVKRDRVVRESRRR